MIWSGIVIPFFANRLGRDHPWNQGKGIEIGLIGMIYLLEQLQKQEKRKTYGEA